MKSLEINGAIFKSSDHRKIPDLSELEKIGAGHDGVVYRHEDLVYKLLKYDILERKTKDLMTFEKATYFLQNLKLNRITQPVDILLDSDGIYSGYVMDFFCDVTKDESSSHFQKPGSFLLSDLHESIDELEEDVDSLNSARVIIHDINRGSYIYCDNYLNMCDMDKFRIDVSRRNYRDLNRTSLNFFIVKALYYEMERSGLFTKDELKILVHWVKRRTNSADFIKQIRADCLSNPNYPISEYAKEKGKLLVR